MADISDVENALAAVIAQVVYPRGTGNPSLVNLPCRIYRGWPIPASLDADLKSGVINISVFPQNNEQNVTKYPKEWIELPNVTPQLVATVSGNTLTLTGTITTPLNVAVILNNKAYAYAVQANDTPTSIATALAELINADVPAVSSGPVVTVTASLSFVPSPLSLSVKGLLGKRFGGALLESLAGFWPSGGSSSAPSVTMTARVSGLGSVIRETRRQKRSIMLTFWCPDPASRDSVVPPVDAALADISFLTLIDGSQGRLRYERSPVSDRTENEKLYRRDLVYSVEYATTDTTQAPVVIAQKLNLSGGLDPSAPVLKTFYK